MREGQQRIEVSPGNYVWMDEADRKAFAERQQGKSKPVQAPARPDIETTSMVAAERAVLPAPRANKPESQQVPEKVPAAKSSAKRK